MNALRMAFAALVAGLLLTGCMSDNKLWALMKAQNGGAAATVKQAESKTTIEGPAEIKLSEGGKAVFEAK